MLEWAVSGTGERKLDYSCPQRLGAAAHLCRLLDHLAVTLARPATVESAADWLELGRELACVHAVLAGEVRVRRCRPRSRTPHIRFV